MPEYKSPQNESGNERNFLLVFLVMAVVIFGSQFFLKKFMPQPPATTAQPAQQTSSAATPSAAQPPAMVTAQGSGKQSSAKQKSGKQTQPAAPTSIQAATESETVVENALYRITFTNRGAQVKSWVLKKFQDDAGKPLDLVNASAAVRYGFPLSLWTYHQHDELNSVLYVPSVSTPALAAPAVLSFEYSDTDSGLTVRKAFHFDDTYVLSVDVSVTQNGSPIYAFPAWPAGFGDQATLPAYAASQFEYQFNSETEHIAPKKVIGGDTRGGGQGSFNWAGVSGSYFAAVFIPDNPDNLSVVTLRNPVEVVTDSSKPNETKPADVLGLAVGHPGQSTERLFVGPKSLDATESVPVPTIIGADKDLRALVNFGSLGVIARPLFAWPYIGLRWIHGYVHNWGWAIVLQTILITIILLPLRIFQMKSALKMQKAAPQIKAIQEKYKKYKMSDPRKADMNKEIADLYKRENVNPISGCLPLIVQLPFLFAYYRMLSNAIDLRQAHWLWIHDLSASEPFPFLLPLLMVVSMFLMQKMTPQAGMDPAQQRMMTVMMPLMMGFIFFRLAAGLNLYYAESNLIMIVQQAIMNRTSLGREMKEIAAKRARKKDK
jgi:YidC/Oxa1 family membrane protein insertase